MTDKDNKTNFMLVRGAVTGAMLLLVSLFLSYNTYKEYMRSVTGFNPYTPELKAGIKGAFPAAIIVFLSLYILFFFLSRSKEGLGFKGYFKVIPLYLAAVNVININGWTETLVIVNVSAAYFALLAALPYLVKKLAGDARLRRFLKARPAESLLYGFVILMLLSALMTVFGYDKGSEKTTNAAYLLFAAGLSVHFFLFVKNGGFNAKED